MISLKLISCLLDEFQSSLVDGAVDLPVSERRIVHVIHEECSLQGVVVTLKTLGEAVEHYDVALPDFPPGHGVVAAVRVDARLYPGPGVLEPGVNILQ